MAWTHVPRDGKRRSEAGAGRGLYRKNPRKPPCAQAIALRDDLAELLDRVALNEVDGAAPETGSGHPRCDSAGYRSRDLDQRIEFWRADLVEVTQRGVTFCEQASDRPEITRLEGRGASKYPSVFADHMSRAQQCLAFEKRLEVDEHRLVNVA